MATLPHNSSQSPYKYGTKEWHQWRDELEAREVAARPVTNRKRHAMTPEEFENYRINGMPKVIK